MALLATAIGSGILALPYIAKQSGVLIALTFLVLGGVLAYISMSQLIHFSYLTGKHNYAEIVEDILGKRVGTFLHCMFIFYAFGCNVTY